MRVFAPGDTVNGYRVESVLGRGGMGIVYEATQLSLDRRVALKVLSAAYSDDPEFRERFRREALIQGGLTHPHVVAVHDAGEIDGTPYIVMRLIRGATLKELLDQRALGAADLLGMLGQIAEALDAAHADQLVHRDVKPHNILVRGRKAYLADFGLTRLLTDAGFTAAGQYVGSVRYIAPEQIIGRNTTGAADVYALTAVLFEGLTGMPPYARDTEMAMLYAHTYEPPPKATEVRPELPDALDEVIARGMAKDPGERYAGACELIDAARAALGLPPHER